MMISSKCLTKLGKMLCRVTSTMSVTTEGETTAEAAVVGLSPEGVSAINLFPPPSSIQIRPRRIHEELTLENNPCYPENEGSIDTQQLRQILHHFDVRGRRLPTIPLPYEDRMVNLPLPESRSQIETQVPIVNLPSPDHSHLASTRLFPERDISVRRVTSDVMRIVIT